MFAKRIAAASVAALTLFASSAQANDVTVDGSGVLHVAIAGVSAMSGHVRVAICSVSDFLKDCRYEGAAPATPGVTVVTVKDLPPGVYAAQAYEDRNDSHSVDRNILGVPKVGVGFSNNAPIHLAPPSFQSAAFTYTGGDQTISFTLRHFGG